jgi:hypothetical protein
VATLRPLSDLIKTEILGSDRRHVDDMPIKVLDPARRTADGKSRGVKEGRIWVYVRDDRPFGGSDPPGVAYDFSPDRKGEHPQTPLAAFQGILQADAYSGFRKLYEPGPDGVPRIRETACWAHLRRDFHDVWKMAASSIAKEALDRIGALYDIERAITGRSAEVRRHVRQEHSKPRVVSKAALKPGPLPDLPATANAPSYPDNAWAATTPRRAQARPGT